MSRTISLNELLRPKAAVGISDSDSFTLQGVSMFFMSEYSDQQLLTALADTRVPNVVLYPWQVRISEFWTVSHKSSQVRMMSQSSTLEVYDMSQVSCH